MVDDAPKIPRKAWGWRYHYGLNQLHEAYRSSRHLSDTEMERVKAESVARQKLVDAGEAVWVEEDEDGFPVYDYGDHLGDRMCEAESILSIVRSAFAISIYHYFESMIWPQLKRGGQKKFEHDKAVEWLRKPNWQPDVEALEVLRLAANCAKHGEGNSAQKLWEKREDMFDERIKGWGAEPSNETLSLTDDHITEFFRTARAGIPRMPISL
jgi:hypothetical protein